MRCVETIESQLNANPSLDGSKVYLTTVLTKDMRQIKADIEKSLDHFKLKQLDTHIVANVLKKYLRELLDPVIPTHWYEKFIELAKGEFIEVNPSVNCFPVRDKGNFTIFGDVTIDIVCSGNTKNIVLHINDIDAHEETIQVSGEGLEGILVHHTYFDKITQFFTIYLSDELKAGMQLSLTMSYLAKLNRLGGFYRSSYFDENHNISSIYYDNMDGLRLVMMKSFSTQHSRCKSKHFMHFYYSWN
ncbi:hypothetical protein QYM36_018755 [Artemia franciscana]|uniref:Rho-GAP domain-containing protein n=1 Tax=Artemia franciscana TaxID=6661 RepID=A0AA88H1X8_ARTSF|nr:hypothetical protein QYM36_018755 [Artemia franciscana]